MSNLKVFRYVAAVAFLAALYYCSAKAGLLFAIPPGNATAVWPPSGIAMAALLLFGYRLWPGVWLGAFSVNLATNVTLPTALLMGTGNTLEPLVATWLFSRLVGRNGAFSAAGHAFLFAALGAVACAVAATFGTAGMMLGDRIGWAQLPPNWVTWWLGDLASIMIGLPALLALAEGRRSKLAAWRWTEISLLLASLAVVGMSIFGGWLSPQTAANLLYVPMVLLIWVCLRFKLLEVTLAAAAFSMAAMWGLSHGLGAFGDLPLKQSLADLQCFAIIYAMTGLAMTGEVTRRRRAEATLRGSRDQLEQAVRDKTKDLAGAVEKLQNEIAERSRIEETLKESEHRFRTLFERAGDASFLVESTGRLLDVNQHACELLGYSRDEILSLSVPDFDPDYTTERVREVFRRLQAGVPVTVESTNRRKDGTAFPVEVRAGLIELQGKPAILATVRDITERKRIQEMTRLRLDVAMESIGEGIIFTETDGTIRYVNTAFEKISGYARSEVVGKNPRLLQSGVHDAGFYRKMWEAISHGEVWTGTFIDRRKNGEPYDVDATIAPVRDPSGAVFGYVAINRDVTQRRRWEESLRASEARLRAIVDTAADGIITIDEHGTIESCNPAAAATFGYSIEETLGNNVSMLMPPPFCHEHDGYLEAYLRTGTAKVIGSGREMVGKRKDGSIFPLDLSVSEVRFGNTRLFTGIVRDVTERHAKLEADRALLAAQQEFRIARDVQQTFFPAGPPSLPGLDISGASYPATEAGGDYFDYLALPGGRVAAVVADVSGHGIGPALLMSEMRACLRALLPLCRDTGELLTRLNEFLKENSPPDRFVTLFLAEFDVVGRTWSYAGAGHQCYLLEPTGEVEALRTGSLPLGIFSQPVASSAPRGLQPGQILLMLTDGIEEAHAPDGTLFGSQRTLDLVRANRDKSAAEIVDILYREARQFSEGTPQEDDVTIVVVKVEAT